MNKKIAKNYIYTIVYKVLSIIAPLITTPYISRVLHSEGVGIYSYTFSIATAFALVAALGINTYGQREIAYRQNDYNNRVKVFDEIFQIRIITTSVVAVFYVLFCSFYTKYITPLVFQSALVISTMFDISWYFQGIENFKIVVVRNLLIKFATIGLIFAFVKSSSDVEIYILINSLSTLISNIIFFVNLKVPLFKYKLTKEVAKAHSLGAITFFIPLIAVEIYSHLDKIMLGVLVGSDIENGYYEQARKITQFVVTIVTSINVVMLPRISNLYAENSRAQIKDYLKKSLNLINLVMFPCIVGLFLVSDQFVLWFFGDDFMKVSELLKICCFMIPFMGIGNFVGMQYLSPTNQQNKMTKAYIIAAVSNIVLNFAFIPKLASVGALLASAIAEFISCGMQVFYLQKSEYKLKMNSGLWKCFISSAIMAGCLVLVNNSINLTGVWHTLFNMFIGTIVYAVSLIIFREEFVWILLHRMKRKV